MIRLSGIEKQFGGKPVLKGIGLAMAAGSVSLSRRWTKGSSVSRKA